MSGLVTADLAPLTYTFNGTPFIIGEATSATNEAQLGSTFNGTPFLFQPGNAGASSVSAVFGETLDALDSTLTLNVTLNLTETFNATDLLSTYPLSEGDTSDITDQLQEQVLLSLTETLDTTDSLTITQSASSGSNETGNLTDSLLQYITLNLSETLNATDTVSVFNGLTLRGTMVIEVMAQLQLRDTMKIEVATVQQTLFSQSLNTLPITNVLVANSSGVNNPFQPTYSVDGVIIVSNACTVFTPSGVGVQVNLTTNPIFADLPLCNIISANINLGFGGGTWSLKSTSPINTLVGATINIANLIGICSYKGTSIEQPYGFVYEAHGIFGNRNMNKQIQLVAQIAIARGTYSIAGQLLPTQSVQTPPPGQWTTLSQAAAALGFAAGMKVAWAAKDAPLTDMMMQSGETVIAALNALAAKVGAVVCWDGAFGFIVINPISAAGTSLFSVPNCKFIDSQHIGETIDLDQSIVILPVNDQLGQQTIIVNGIAQNTFAGVSTVLYPPVLNSSAFLNNQLKNVLQQINNDFSPTDAGRNVTLPKNFDNMYFQIVTKDRTATGSGVTVDPNAWIQVQYPVQTASDGRNFVTIDSTVLPSGSIPNGATYYFATSEKALPRINAFNASQDNQTAVSSAIAATTQEIIRYGRIQEGNITTLFFGAVPLPGGGLTLQDNVNFFSGIIESVGVSFGANGIGTITISGAKYARLNLNLPKGTLDNSSVGTG